MIPYKELVAEALFGRGAKIESLTVCEDGDLRDDYGDLFRFREHISETDLGKQYIIIVIPVERTD